MLLYPNLYLSANAFEHILDRIALSEARILVVFTIRKMRENAENIPLTFSLILTLFIFIIA